MVKIPAFFSGEQRLARAILYRAGKQRYWCKWRSAASARRDVPPVHPIALGGDYNGGRELFRMTDMAMFIGLKTHLHGLGA